MKNRTFCIVAAAQLLAAAFAQTPGDASATRPAAPPEAKLHSLQLLLTETIFARQPLAPESQPKPGAPGNTGSAGDRPFAVVRDATFEPDGRLTSLIVEAPSTDAGRGGSPRVLPARSVQWDEATKRWVVSELSLTWEELAEFKNPGTEPPAKEPATAPATPRAVLASELLNATITGFEPSPAAKTEAIETKGNTKTRVVWWMSPLHEQLAFAVVAHGDKFLPVPWALMRTSGQGSSMQVRIQAAPTAAEGSPTVASAMEQPSAAVRQAAYRHYSVEAPKWDQQTPQPMKADDHSAAKGENAGKEPKHDER